MVAGTLAALAVVCACGQAHAQTSPPAPPTDTERPNVQQASDLQGAPADTSLSFLKGFADIGAGYSGKRERGGFGDGSLDLYMTPRLSEHVKMLVELVFEYGEEGDLAVDLERIQVGYTFDRGATLWLGRFHTPLGYWNTAFHHGQQLQTSITRPRFIDFEDRGGVLPSHTVGVLASGARAAGPGRLHYDVFVGNSPTLADGVLDPANTGHEDPSLSAGVNASYRLQSDVPLILGVHGYRTTVRDSLLDGPIARVQIAGAYAAVDSSRWDIVAEYYRFSNGDASPSGDTHVSWAGFAQVGRRFDRWLPYGRLERAAFDPGDRYFAQQASGQSYHRRAVGVRYDLTSNSALKLEATQTRETRARQRYAGLKLQWAVRF